MSSVHVHDRRDHIVQTNALINYLIFISSIIQTIIFIRDKNGRGQVSWWSLFNIIDRSDFFALLCLYTDVVFFFFSEIVGHTSKASTRERAHSSRH